MFNNRSVDSDQGEIRAMKRSIIPGVVFALMGCAMLFLEAAHGGPPLRNCSIGASPPGRAQPRCGCEISCTDKFMQLGYQKSVCFRAACPGIWALIHRRTDQASFKRRFFTYRHYHFVGYWELKDQGTIEAGLVPLRELFLVLPGDLIEFRLAEPDCRAKVDVRNLGYIKKGNPGELQKWLAYRTYMEAPALERMGRSSSVKGSSQRACAPQGRFHWPRRGPLLHRPSIVGLPSGR